MVSAIRAHFSRKMRVGVLGPALQHHDRAIQPTVLDCFTSTSPEENHQRQSEKL